MSETAATGSTDPAATDDKLTPGEFLDSLLDLGRALPVNFHPPACDQSAVTAGLIWFLGTGSLQPPKVEAPDEAGERQQLAELTRENELQARIAELERQQKAGNAAPSQVAPPAPAASEPVSSETPPTLGGVEQAAIPPAQTGQVDPSTASPANPATPAPGAGESDGAA